MNWRRILRLAVPLALLLFAVGFITALEHRRGPDWRLELDEYLASHASPAETLTVEAVVRARKPWHFTAEMGEPESGDWIVPSYPPQAVRCALLARRSGSGGGAGETAVRQVVFLVHHSDALYRVGWLAHAGPEEPFGPGLRAHLALIGCDLELE
jgi:hypothetical protein